MIRGLFYPDRCLLCGDLIPYGTRWTVCRRCSAVPYLPQGNRCPICSRMVSQPGMTCRSCRKHGNTIRGTAALRYEGAAAKAVQQLKYEGMRSLADAMARIMIMTGKDSVQGSFFLVPVPVHPKRKKERGYNQAFELASALAGQLGVPVVDCLFRVRDTRALKKMGASDRRSSMQNAVEILPDTVFPQGKAILVDDIYTSGSTVEECARALKRHCPALSVGFWTLTIREEHDMIQPEA